MSYNTLKLEIGDILKENPIYEGRLDSWLNYHDGRWELVDARPNYRFAQHARRIGVGNLLKALNRILSYMTEDPEIISKIKEISVDQDGTAKKKVLETRETAGLLLIQMLEDLSEERKVRELPALQRQKIKLVVDNTQKENENGSEERETRANNIIGVGHQG